MVSFDFPKRYTAPTLQKIVSLDDQSHEGSDADGERTDGDDLRLDPRDDHRGRDDDPFAAPAEQPPGSAVAGKKSRWRRNKAKAVTQAAALPTASGVGAAPPATKDGQGHGRHFPGMRPTTRAKSLNEGPEYRAKRASGIPEPRQGDDRRRGLSSQRKKPCLPVGCVSSDGGGGAFLASSWGGGVVAQ